MVLVLVTLGLFFAGWQFSSMILIPDDYQLYPEFEILEVTPDTVTLPVPPSDRQFANTRKTGRYNLLWDGGTGALGELLEDDGGRVVRTFRLQDGELPEAGTPARLDHFIYHQDPASDLGLDYEALQLDGPVGSLQAWWLEQSGDVAVLMLHGRRRGRLAETLRFLPSLQQQGYPVLALAYRNHDQSAMSPDGFYHYGASEWQDALVGLEQLRRLGYERYLLYGISMGGAVALELTKVLRERGDTLPEAIILDSPLLDTQSVMAQGARNMGIPLAEPLTRWAMWIAGLRAGVDWRSLDQRRTGTDLGVPLLLIHGSDDQTVPVSLADTFAQAWQSSLRYERVEGADHVDAWNEDPQRYERWLEAFLSEHAPVQRDPE